MLAPRIPTTSTTEIDVIPGGSKWKLAKSLARNPRSKVFYVDNPTEVEDHKDELEQFGVECFALAQCETSASLFSDCDDIRVIQALKQISNTSLSPGLGARPVFALAAAQRLGLTPQFEAFLDSLPGFVTRVTRGKARLVRIRVHGSYAGAVAAGLARFLVDLIVEKLRGMGIAVEIEFNLLGPVTFIEQNTRAFRTASCALANFLADVVRHPARENAKVVKYLRLHDFQPTWDNAERDTWVAIEHQAFNAIPLQDKLSIRRPNQSATDRFGNVYLTESRHSFRLDPASEVAPDVASQLYSQICEGIAQVHLLDYEVEQFYCEDIPELVSVGLTESVLEMADRSNARTCYRLLTSTTNRHSMRAMVRMKNGETYDLSLIPATFGRSANSLDEAIRRVSLIATFEQLVRDSQRELEPLIADAQREIQGVLAEDYAASQRSAFSKSRANKRRREAAFQEICLKTRNESDSLETMLELLSLLCDLVPMLRRQRIDREKELYAIKATLDRFLPVSQGSQRAMAVVAMPMQTAFPILRDLSQLADHEQVDRLCELADYITTEGLARLTGSTSQAADALARSIIQSPEELDFVPHGSLPRHDTPTRAYIVPRMQSALAQEIGTIVKTLAPHAIVAFTNAISHGVALVEFNIRRAFDTDEVFVGLLREHLETALQSDDLALNMADIEQTLRTLGISLENGRLVFGKLAE